MNKWLIVTVVVLSVLLVVVYGRSCVPRSNGTGSPEQLARLALEADTAEEREQAAADLSQSGEGSVDLMRRVFGQSKSPEVRAIIAQGLGHYRDVDSVPVLIDGMEDESFLVRERTGVAVRKIVGIDFGFKPGESTEHRQKRVALYRTFWADVQKPGARWIEFMNNPQKSEDSARETAEKILNERKESP